MGDLFCLDAQSGSVLWSKNLPRTYGAAVPLWGYAGHPLVYKDFLICTVGCKGSAVVAFDNTTGQEVWKGSLRRKLVTAHRRSSMRAASRNCSTFT
jgi:outer membrane protein assembly factor BamB